MFSYSVNATRRKPEQDVNQITEKKINISVMVLILKPYFLHIKLSNKPFCHFLQLPYVYVIKERALITIR